MNTKQYLLAMTFLAATATGAGSACILPDSDIQFCDSPGPG